MDKNTMQSSGVIYLTKQTEQIQITEPEFSELFKKAFLEEESSVSNEYCQNTTSWD